MSEEGENNSKLADRIAKRSRKIGMLVQSNRSPKDKETIRRDFKRREKLAEMRKIMKVKRISKRR